MAEPPRRRRADEERGEGGLPLFPLVLVVILAGLLLGGVLAHFFGGSNRAPTPATRIAVAPATQPPALVPSPSAAPSATPSPVASSRSAIPSPTPAKRATPAAGVSPSARPTIKATAAVPTPTPAVITPAPRRSAATPATPPPPPTLHPAATLRPAVTAHPAAPRPVATASVVSAVGGDPSGVVRAYLAALARGDRQTAAGYLSHGAPTESFMTADSRIAAIRSAAIGSQQYRVTADVQTGSGEYYVTFTVAPGPGGLQITDHYAIKAQ